MSDNYSHDIDVTDPGEPDYQAHFDKPIVIPDYEEWSQQLQPSIHELDEIGEYYEHQRPF